MPREKEGSARTLGFLTIFALFLRASLESIDEGGAIGLRGDMRIVALKTLTVERKGPKPGGGRGARR